MTRSQFRQARETRGLSLEQVARDLSARVGFTIHRATLANWELGRTQEPRARVMRAIEMLMSEWSQEDGLGRRWVARETDSYDVDHECECGARVPGPLVGARFCLACGALFPPLACPECGTPLGTGFKYCSACGACVTCVTSKGLKHTGKH